VKDGADRLIVLSVNQDRGIGPLRTKGAAVHLTAMRQAFTDLGADCRAIDMADDTELLACLNEQLSAGGIDLIYERYALGKSVTARFASQHAIPLVLEVTGVVALTNQRMLLRMPSHYRLPTELLPYPMRSPVMQSGVGPGRRGWMSAPTASIPVALILARGHTHTVKR